MTQIENQQLPLDPEIEMESGFSDVLMEKPFNPSEIRIEHKPLTIDLLVKRLKADPVEIDLMPSYQRKGDLWDREKQSRLIESLLIKFPLPAFYFDGSNNDHWLVVDGLQRLSTLKNFMIKKSLKLTGLEFLTKLEGYGYDDLPRNFQRQIEEAQVIAYIINPGTPEEVKFNIFKRINTGGLILNSQEIRHALNQGVPANFVAELATLPEFKVATGWEKESPRMLDREFVTRFIAFFDNDYRKYSPELDSFLNASMRELKGKSTEELECLKEAFRKAVITGHLIFGEDAFRKLDNSGRRKPLNRALFEVWSVLIAQLNDTERQSLIKEKSNIIEAFRNLLATDQKFVESITVSTGSKSNVLRRFSTIEELIRSVLNR